MGIETAFVDFYATVPQWWRDTVSAAEQREWAVMDIHWYSAWAGDACSGRTAEGGAYFCDDPIEEIREKVQGCIKGFTQKLAHNFPGLKATSEFSLGTYDQALFACTDPAPLGVFLNEQVKAFNQDNIQPFFWTWRMPYGPAFEPGWSLKHALGKESAHRDFPCFQPASAEL